MRAVRASSAAAPTAEVTKGALWPKMQSCGEVIAARAMSGSRSTATSGLVASTWKATPSAPTESSGLRKRFGGVGSDCSATCGACRSA